MRPAGSGRTRRWSAVATPGARVFPRATFAHRPAPSGPCGRRRTSVSSRCRQGDDRAAGADNQYDVDVLPLRIPRVTTTPVWKHGTLALRPSVHLTPPCTPATPSCLPRISRAGTGTYVPFAPCPRELSGGAGRSPSLGFFFLKISRPHAGAHVCARVPARRRGGVLTVKNWP